MRRAEVRLERGKPTLYVDGKLTAPVFYALSDIPASRAWTDQARKNIKNFADCGINVVCVDTCLYYGWKEGAPYDASEPLKEVRAAVEANPDAAVIIRLHLNPPYEWMTEHRDQTYGYYGVEPTVRDGYGDRLIANDDRTELRVSLASDEWRRDCGDVLTQFCRAIRDDKYGQSVIGLHLACGLYGEWHPWGFFDFDGDYSPAMLKFFREMLIDKYSTDEALQAAWKDQSVTLSAATLPIPNERNAARDGRYRYPEIDMRAIDAFRAGQMAITSAIAHFSRIVKTELPQTLVGVFYGYFFNTTWANSRAAHGGCHLGISEIYDNPDIDYIAAPFCYTATRVAGNALRLRSLLESARLNGKLCLCEMDQAPIGSDIEVGGTAEHRAESIALLKRNILGGLIHGMGAWYYDHRLVPNGSIYEKNGWWDHPELLAEITKLTELANDIAARPFIKQGEVLLVCDTERFYYVSTAEMTGDEAEFLFHDSLGKSGAGYDAVYLRDLSKVELDRYKAVIFMDCVVMDEAQYEFVKNKVCAFGRTVVFLGDNGIICGDRHDRARHEALTLDEGREFSDVRTQDARIIRSRALICDRDYWRELFMSAGVHIWTQGGEFTAVDDGYLLLHAAGVEKSEINFSHGKVTCDNPPVFTALYDVKTGKRVL